MSNSLDLIELKASLILGPIGGEDKFVWLSLSKWQLFNKFGLE